MSTIHQSWDAAGIIFHAGFRAEADGQGRLRCPYCTDGRKHHKERDLSVNTIDMTFHCHHCGEAGAIRPNGRIHEGAGDRPLSQRKKTYVPPRPMPAEKPFDGLLTDWLQSRNLSQTTARHFGLWSNSSKPPQADDHIPSVHIPYFVGGTHINTKHRTITGERHYWMEKGAEQPFFNYDAIAAFPDQPLIICEGELDALSIHEAGLHRVVSVPGGAPDPKFPEANFHSKFAFLESASDLLATVDRFILATDGDSAGKILEGELARRLGAAKCRRVLWPDGCKDANDVLAKHGPKLLNTIVANAPVYPIVGLYTGEDFAEDLMHAYEHGWDKGVKCGLSNLDAICRLSTGRVSVWTGHSSAGKSTVLDNVLVGLATTSDWRIGMYSPEQMPLARHQAQLLQIKAGKPFDRLHPKGMTAADVEIYNWWTSEYFSYIHPEARRDVDTILDHLRTEVMRRGINCFVLDPWNCVADEKPHHMSGTDWINKVMFDFKLGAQELNIHIAIVAHPTKMRPAKNGEPEPIPTLTDISGSINFRNQCDYGIVVHRDPGDTKRRNLVDVMINKIRYQETGEAGQIAHFEYHPETAIITPVTRPTYHWN